MEKLCSWLLGKAKVACTLRGIPVPIGAGALRNSKLKSFRIVAVKSLQLLLRGIISRGIISRRIFAEVVATLTLPLISAIKSLRYGNFVLTTTVPMAQHIKIINRTIDKIDYKKNLPHYFLLKVIHFKGTNRFRHTYTCMYSIT